MLGKLIKYDFKALKKTLLPVCLGAVALAVFTTIVMKLFFVFNDYNDNLPIMANTVFESILTLLLVFGFLALVASAFIAWFLLLQRYYKNCFKDEGYLTFTLPVKTGNILLGKLISAGIWALITGVFAIISIIVFLIFGTSQSFINMDIIRGFSEAWNLFWNISNFTTLDYILIPTILILTVLCSIAQNILLFYLAITLGNQIAKRHKILASVGMYFAVNTVSSILVSTAMTVFTFLGFPILESLDNQPMRIIYIYFLIAILISASLSVVYFFVNKAILKKRLNLE